MSFQLHAFSGSNALDRVARGGASMPSPDNPTSRYRTLDVSIFPNASFMSDDNKQYSVLGRKVAVGPVLTGDSTQPLDMNGGAFAAAVQSLSGSGTITVEGTSITRDTNIPVYSDTETITVTSVGGFKGEKLWVEIKSINVTPGAITYQPYTMMYARLPYDIRITGYTMQAVSSSGRNDVALRLYTYSGGSTVLETTLENIDIDNTPSTLTDGARVAPFDRSFTLQTSADLFGQRQTFYYEQTDFDTFCDPATTGTLPVSNLVATSPATASGANIVRCKSRNDGFVLDVSTRTGTLQTRLTAMQIRLYYEILD